MARSLAAGKLLSKVTESARCKVEYVLWRITGSFASLQTKAGAAWLIVHGNVTLAEEGYGNETSCREFHCV
jgi:hypothetical protein